MAKLCNAKHSRKYFRGGKLPTANLYKSNQEFVETVQNSKYGYARVAGYVAKQSRQPRISPAEYTAEEAREWRRGYDSFDGWKRAREQR